MRFFTLRVVVDAYRNLGTKGYYSSKPSWSYKNKDKTTNLERKQRRPRIQWTEEQKSVLAAVEQRKSVFITGSAGTGKTKLVTEVVKLLKKLHTRSKVFVTASTGVSAFAIKGQTLHSFAGIHCSNENPVEFLKEIMEKKGAIRRWKKVEALVIDEISMLDARLFDNLEFVAKELRGVDERWGGIQLVVVGDFCQLPPVPDPNCYSVRYAFEADCWNDSFDLQIELTKIFRQSDPRFIELLQSIRRGESDNMDLSFLEEHCSKTVCDPSAVQLFPLRETVEKMNKKKLEMLGEEVFVYTAFDTAKKNRSRRQVKQGISNDDQDGDNNQWMSQLKKGIAPDKICICEGARVMLIKNLHTWRGLVNGATGTVVRFVEAPYVGDVCSSKVLPVIKFDSGKELVVEPEEWHVMDGDEIVATREQIPLILAWAISIHKCQGTTLDKVRIDLKQAFGCGMVYTALSRAKSLDGLHLSGFNPSKILVDRKVSQFYRNLDLKRNGKDLGNNRIESKDSSISISGDLEKVEVAETMHFSLSEFLARRMKRS